LTVNGSLTASSVTLDSPSAVLGGNGSVLAPVVITTAGNGAMITGFLTVSNPNGVAIDVDAGVTKTALSGITVTGSNIGILVEPGSGNDESITVSVRCSGVLRRRVGWRLSHPRGSHADVPQHPSPFQAGAILA